jgi:hypothetical protein
LGGYSVVTPVPIPRDCIDGFAEAFFGRPEAFLDERVRRAQSAWGFVSREEEDQSVDRLSKSLEDGSWEQKYGELRHKDEYLGALSLVVASPS